jgi:hypothetical protein
VDAIGPPPGSPASSDSPLSLVTFKKEHVMRDRCQSPKFYCKRNNKKDLSVPSCCSTTIRKFSVRVLNHSWRAT